MPGSIKNISVLSSVLIILNLLENGLWSRRRDASEGEMLQKISGRGNDFFCKSHLQISSALLHASFASCMTEYKITCLMTIPSPRTLPFPQPETPVMPDVEESYSSPAICWSAKGAPSSRGGNGAEVCVLPCSDEWRSESPVVALDQGRWRLRHCRLSGLRSGLFWRTWVRWWCQWVTRWNNYGTTGTLNFSLFNNPSADIISNINYSYFT